MVLGGFTVSGIGLNSATVAMTDAAFIMPQSTFDFSYFISAAGDPDITLSDADLVDGTRNYVEAELSTLDGVPLVKAFWDPEANSGNGAEFNQIVNTITDLRITFVVSTGGFSGSPDRLPIAIIDTDGSGVIKLILDRRELYGRLGKPNDIDNEYSWGTKQEPVYQLNMTATAGTFVAGETITIGSETATVVTGGTSSITFNVPSGINFSNGDSVLGGTSGATGTVNTVFENFLGVDKSLAGQKEINDALMTEIKLLKATRFWWQTPVGTLASVSSFINSVIVPVSSGAKIVWSGTALSITDSNGSPADADVVAKIRAFSRAQQFNLTRQDGTGGSITISIADGQVLYVDIPASGDRAFSGVGSGATNYRVVARDSFVQSSTTYWLAYREGSRLFFRGTGELQTGESSEIGDNVPQTLLDNLGLVNEVTPPSYSSDIRGVAAQSLVSRIGVLTDATGDEQEDRSGYFRSDDEIAWTSNEVQFTADIVLELLNTKSGTLTQHSVLVAESPIALNDGESAWIEIDRTNASETCVLKYSDVDPIPAQVQADKDVFVLFRRKDANSIAYLHIPFHKQLMEPDQQVRLGASGSGGGIPAVFIQEVPTGVVDGVNDTFTLSQTPKSDESVMVTVDSLFIPQSEYAILGTVITFNPGSIPQIAQSVDAFYVADSANTMAAFQEVPSGVIDGLNDTFGLSAMPPYKNAVLVVLDGLILAPTQWNLIQGVSTSAIQFNVGTIPQPGQSIVVMYFTVGSTGGGGGGGSTTEVEYRTITGGEAAAKQLTLAATPAVAGDTLLDMKNVGMQFYGDDFTISGNILGWSGLGLDSVPVVAGDKFRIVYFT